MPGCPRVQSRPRGALGAQASEVVTAMVLCRLNGLGKMLPYEQEKETSSAVEQRHRAE
jgi:hypothetical protein